MSKKIIIILSILSILSIAINITLGISNLRLYVKKEDNRMNFIRTLYFQTDDAITSLSAIKEGKDNDIKDKFTQVVDNLNKIESTIEYANSFMDNSVYYTGISAFGMIGNGIPGSDGFLKDGKISKNELIFLNSVKKDLENIKKQLYSKETKQENDNITIEQINNMLISLYKKYDKNED